MECSRPDQRGGRPHTKIHETPADGHLDRPLRGKQLGQRTSHAPADHGRLLTPKEVARRHVPVRNPNRGDAAATVGTVPMAASSPRQGRRIPEHAVLFEVYGNRSTPIDFPLPWAPDSNMSCLVPPEAFRDVIARAGFDITVWHDKTDIAQKAFASMTQPVGEPTLPELGVHLLVGSDILTKAYNLHRNLDEERVSLIEPVAVRPI